MAHKERNKCYLPNLDSASLTSAASTITTATITTCNATTLSSNSVQFSTGTASTPNTAGGITRTTAKQMAPRHDVFTFTDAVVTIADANEYGSLKICDLPATNIIIIGCIVNLVGTPDGTYVDDVTAVDYALGTSALASIDFSGSGEKDVILEKDVAASGVMQVATTTELNTLHAQGAKAIYMNMQDTVTGGDGTVTLAGTVEIIYIDLGDETA